MLRPHAGFGARRSVEVVVTARDDGNLALHVEDDPARVRANRARLAKSLGVDRVQFMHQVHGRDVAVVDVPADDDVAGVDALVTATPGVAVAVLVADCVPVVIAGSRAVGVAHAGRRGVAANVVAATVEALRRLDDGPLHAFVGPAVCGRCYEVPAPMQQEVAAVVSAAHATTRSGTAALDLPAAVRAQLRACDVDVDDTESPCTIEDERFYSHRREGATGRFAVVARLP